MSCIGNVNIHADSTTSSVGTFRCSEASSITIHDSVFVDITATEIDLSCNVTGVGDMGIKCSTPACNMSLGDTGNNFASSSLFHLSNVEFSNLMTTGNIVFGSLSTFDNVSNIFIDNAHIESLTSSLTIGSSHGSILFSNESSSIGMAAENSTVVLRAAGSATIGANTTFSQIGIAASITVSSDFDCLVEGNVGSDSVQFVIPDSVNLLFDTVGEVKIEAPFVNLSGTLNVTEASLLRFEGETSGYCFYYFHW